MSDSSNISLIVRIALFVFLASMNTAFAQQDTLADVFPLAIGNKWTYSFRLSSVNGGSHTSTTDTGIAEYSVVAALPSEDSTRWQIFLRRSFTRYIYGYPYLVPIQDSSNTEIIELTQGRHQLYTPAFNPFEAFPFQKSLVDSLRFFRFRPVGPSGSTTVSLVFPNDNGPIFSYHADFLLRRDTGIVQSSGSQFTGFPSNSIGMRYDLREFRPSFPGPHLSVSQAGFLMRSLYGQPKDSVIALRNDGLLPLVLSNISINDSRFSVSGWTTTVAPLSAGSINVRFNSLFPETVHASLVAYSNSTTSPDTVFLTGEAIAASVLSLSRRLIDFGVIRAGDMRRDSLTITNLGNAPLRIDSVRPSWVPWLSAGQMPNPIAPGQPGVLTILFHPAAAEQNPASGGDYVLIFSNALSPRDSILVRYGWVPSANLTVSTRHIDFGSISFQGFKDTVITITNPGQFSYLFNRYSLAISSFKLLNHEYPTQLGAGEIHRDTIRFAPSSIGFMTDTIRYVSTMSGVITSTDTVILWGTASAPGQYSLEQNFPNPFNPTTTIKFQIPIAALVILKVFDLLGNEVTTLANEELPPGSYERSFDGRGLASGVYFYRFQASTTSRQAGKYMQVRKLLLVK